MSVHEGYALNEEVTTATASLKKAASLGVKTYTNPQLSHLPDKDAILIASFGTTYPKTRANTIEAAVSDIAAAHPEAEVRLAFTSHMIISRIKKREGISYPTPEEALDTLQQEGYTRVALVSFDCIPGLEYDYKAEVFHQYKYRFKKMTLGLPLMYWMGQEEKRDDIIEVLTAVQKQIPDVQEQQAVLLMAHGTPHPANAYYAVLQDRLEAMNLPHTYVYSVEGSPHLEDILPKLKAASVKKVLLMPLMMVAGDHACNDMAGDEDDSHKRILEKEGYQVAVYLKGLGENPDIRRIITARADEAVQALQEN